MFRRRFWVCLLVAFLVCFVSTYLAYLFLDCKPKWVIPFTGDNLIYFPMVEDSRHVWLAAEMNLMDWEKKDVGIQKQFVIIDTTSGEIMYTLEMDHTRNLETLSPGRSYPIIINDVLYRFTYHRDEHNQYCELRAWKFTKGNDEKVIRVWKSLVGTPMFAEFGTPRNQSCAFVVQSVTPLPLGCFVLSGNLLAAVCSHEICRYSTLWDNSTLPLPGESMIPTHFTYASSYLLDAGNNSVRERVTWSLPPFYWSLPRFQGPADEWVMYSKYLSDIKLSEPLFYHAEKGTQYLCREPHARHDHDRVKIINGMIHFGGHRLYRKTNQGLDVLEMGDSTKFKGKVDRHLIGTGDCIYEIDNDLGDIRVYQDVQHDATTTISFRQSGWWFGFPVFANDRYVYFAGMADTRPRSVRDLAKRFPFIDKVWPDESPGSLLQLDRHDASFRVVSKNAFPIKARHDGDRHIYVMKLDPTKKTRVFRELQCWDSMQRVIDDGAYFLIALASFVVAFFVMIRITQMPALPKTQGNEIEVGQGFAKSDLSSSVEPEEQRREGIEPPSAT